MYLEITILQSAGTAAVLGVQLEEPVILDDIVLLQHLGNIPHAGALFHSDGHFLPDRTVTIHFSIKLQHVPACKCH